VLALVRSSGAVASGVASALRVREVADPKCRRAGAGRPRWILESPRSALPGPCPSHWCPGAGIGDQAPEDDVGESLLQASEHFHRGLAGRERVSVVGAAFGVVAQLNDGAMCRTWLPARESRCRICSPDDASRGAVPVQEVKRFRSANISACGIDRNEDLTHDSRSASKTHPRIGIDHGRARILEHPGVALGRGLNPVVFSLDHRHLDHGRGKARAVGIVGGSLRRASLPTSSPISWH
jgi:hypothetical protein